MSYSIKEIYYTLQGEGALAGRAIVLCRFAGCNLWSGYERDRSVAICQFCDTDFVGTDGKNGGRYEDANALALAIDSCWTRGQNQASQSLIQGASILPSILQDQTREQKSTELGNQISMEARCNSFPEHRALPRLTRLKMVVCSGGEPLLQLDKQLIDELHRYGFVVAIETNGTLPAPPEIDWICVSPKANTQLMLDAGDELKLVYPQRDLSPDTFANLGFCHFFLQPMDGPLLQENTMLAINYCLAYPQWRLSLQQHKLLGID